MSFLRIGGGGLGALIKNADFPRLSESGSLGSKAWEFVIIKFYDDSMEEKMATHSSTLAWRIPQKIMASGPITSWQIDGERMEIVRDFILWAPKSLQMLTAAMKLKDACSLEEKL